MQIDWTFLIASALASLGGLGTVAAAAWFAWIKLRRGTTTLEPVKAAERSADDPPPEGSVSWVVDIVDAMSGASDTSKLKAIMDGATRHEARGFRINELEAKP